MYLYDMKIIITEEQYENVILQDSKSWVKRRYDIVKKGLKGTFDFTKNRVCRMDNYEEFERYFFSVFMDILHPYYYDEDTFNYEEVFSTLVYVFYVDCTEFYFAEREKC